MNTRSSGLVLGLAFSAVPASADVLTVDGSGADFVDIESAINAAQEGDTILVKPGIYPQFQLINKSLDIIADVSGTVTINGGPRIANLSPGKRVLLQGFRVAGVASETPFVGHGINLISNIGAVRIENCTLLAASNLFEPPDCQGIDQGQGWNAARIEVCMDVVFADSFLLGGVGVMQDNDLLETCFFNGGGDGGYGAHAIGSNVAFYDCILRGGAGGQGPNGGDGGHGFRGDGGTLFVSGGVIEGSEGGVGYDWASGSGGAGGHGLSGVDFTGHLLHADTMGAPGGVGLYGPDGADGLPTSGGELTVDSGPARLFVVDSPVRVGDTFTLAFRGAPFDAVLLMVSGIDAFLPLPEFHGTLLCFPAASLNLGFLDAQGELALPLTLAPLAGNPDSLTFVLQSFHVSTSLDLVIGSAAHLVALDPAF